MQQEEEIMKAIARLEAETQKILEITEKTRAYFFWTMVASVLLFVVPLIGLLFVIPTFLSGYTGSLDGMSDFM